MLGIHLRNAAARALPLVAMLALLLVAGTAAAQGNGKPCHLCFDDPEGYLSAAFSILLWVLGLV